MQVAASDSIVLVAGAGPEALAALMVLVFAAIGALVGVMMARRGRVEAWSLVGTFGLVMLAAAVALAYLPTRLVLDRKGAELGFWGLADARSWQEIETVSLRNGRLGLWVSVRLRGPGNGGLLWSRWPGFLVPQTSAEPRQVAMRIDAWRLSANR